MIPVELLAIAQWACWRRENAVPTTVTKVPYNPLTRQRANVADPATWVTYREAVALKWKYDGLCFALTKHDPYCGIDLDHCVENGVPNAWALQVIDRLASYTEFSPSGNGIRILVKAKLPPGRRRNERIEMYDDARFLSITGNQIQPGPAIIQERQREINALHAELFPKPKSEDTQRNRTFTPTLEDRELIERARQASEKFDRAWSGELTDWGGDHSRADLYLCGRLAYWTKGDAARMDRLFRQSALMREKWNTRHGHASYGELTITAALAG